MLRATQLAHLLVRHRLRPGAWAVDATVGNGHDTLFLAQTVGPSGRVFGFDIQETALTAAAQRLDGLAHVTLFHSGHECLARRIPAEAVGRLAGVMFNLGYLPGAPKSIITRADTTIAGLTQALAALAVGGVVTLVLYPGHPGGIDEAAAVNSFAQRLPASHAVCRIERLNALQPAPDLLAIERLW
jgi:predicted methyltransferase